MIKKHLQKPRAAARYALWRAGRFLRGHRAAQHYDIHRTYMLDPARISLSLDSPGLDRLAGKRAAVNRTPVLEHGTIVDGDWDRAAVPFESMDIWRACQHRFADQGRWEDTDFYARVTRTIRGGTPLWNCSDTDTFDARLRTLETLYAEMRDHGYRQQHEIAPDAPRPFGDQDEVHVHIDRQGRYLFADGRHRLCLAKLLALPRIPVKVARRHAQWVSLRQRIQHYADRHGGKLYAPLTHPDLADIPATHGHERFELIEKHLDPGSGSALDIGAHWGYFCHRLDAAGYTCSAVEQEAYAADMLNALMQAEGRTFTLARASVLDFEPRQHFDVVLALNIFHHFIKTESAHEGLVRFLKRLEARQIFFEPHDPAEPQMQNAYRNYAPQDFAEFVAQHAGLHGVTRLGQAADGRDLFVLGGR